jgi:hypothetical protein
MKYALAAAHIVFEAAYQEEASFRAYQEKTIRKYYQ